MRISDFEFLIVDQRPSGTGPGYRTTEPEPRRESDYMRRDCAIYSMATEAGEGDVFCDPEPGLTNIAGTDTGR